MNVRAVIHAVASIMIVVGITGYVIYKVIKTSTHRQRPYMRDPAIVLGEPELPEGKVYNDEFLGEQVIYRGNFFVRIPYTVSGDRPESVLLTINSRGCTDDGFCYMPQTWIETVQLSQPAADSGKIDLGSLAGAGTSEFPPPEEVFFPDVYVVDGNTVDLDSEMTKLTENSLKYTVSTHILSKKFTGLKNVIQGGVR